MAQHDDRHLTTEQLSALLDKQLSPQEQAEYNTHLRTCRQCQKVMADLKQTVALLHALPQPTLPRSFVLPATMANTREQHGQPVHPIGTTAQRIPPKRLGQLARRSIRTLSTIAAVIGLVFILSTFLTSLPHGNNSASSGSAPVPVNRGATLGPKTSNGAATPHTQESPSVTKPVTSTPSVKAHSSQNQTNSPAIGLNSPQVYLGVGAILLLIGILGIVLTRKRRE